MGLPIPNYWYVLSYKSPLHLLFAYSFIELHMRLIKYNSNKLNLILICYFCFTFTRRILHENVGIAFGTSFD
jgi:hypothetical protein